MTRSDWGERLFVALQYLLPQRLLSELMHRLSRLRWRPLRRLLIHGFARQYGIDMQQAAEPDLDAYPHFNAFFTRALRAEARPLDPDPRALLCPVDGAISQIGHIEDGRLIQAKGQDYGVDTLLGLDPGAPHPFEGGHFVTIYLSPRDYHRIHMPLTGRLLEMTHVPGALFSVNAATANRVPGLFARNERLVTRFETAAGELAQVLVGAIFVGGIETVWSGVVTPPHRLGPPNRLDYREAAPVELARGAEMGRFNLGSTVVVLLPRGRVDWETGLAPGQTVRLGQRLGTLAD
ncbi:archaetidylserine decarboxylase [Marichromatium gracile]|uniref:archaetidylserine decarboxylase n=1 Tax=Marichromatium gracile TaxID=1048 RepID=UPI001EEA7DD5|nr:archaetidylserine decarboxylase [Marichromatium gracile]MCF1182109.1 archaetidylserine decarboxylase [Marichromatium gracile]